MNLLRSCLVGAGLYGAFVAGAMQLRSAEAERDRVQGSGVRQLPVATLLTVLIIATSTTLQFLFPAMLRMFERDYSRFLAGEWWRLITPLFVQDGGIGGSLFNLVSLLLVGSVAERWWGSRRWLVIFWVGGVVSEAMAFTWQPVGAGNSVANFSLAASIAFACLTSRPPQPALPPAILALGAYLGLLSLKDIHGAAALSGVVLALVLIRFDLNRTRKKTPAI